MAMSRILVADDDEAVLESVTWLLKENGYDVVPANGGEQCLEALEKRAPDLLLLDILMPDADGYLLLERIKSEERWRDLPVLMLSAQPPEDASVRSLGLGASDFIRKPYRPKELLARVQAQLRMGAVLRATRLALVRTEEALVRAQQDADSRRKLVDILHEVTGDLSVSRAVSPARAPRGARAGRLALLGGAGAARRDVGRGRRRVRESQAASAGRSSSIAIPSSRPRSTAGSPCWWRTSTRIRCTRACAHVWGIEGIEIPIRSVIALPFSIERGQYGVFLVRRTRDQEHVRPGRSRVRAGGDHRGGGGDPARADGGEHHGGQRASRAAGADRSAHADPQSPRAHRAHHRRDGAGAALRLARWRCS